jgi:RNA polymerase sigma-70 factor, ECF subfamily
MWLFREPTATATIIRMARQAPDEERLLAAARRGDQRAFARLVERHHGPILGHCTRILGSRHDAEDAWQEALLRAWRGLPRFDGRSAVGSWLYTIATNASLTLLEQRRRRAVLVESTSEGAPDVEESYARRERLELALVATLQHLPARQREALLLTEVLDFTAKEAARILDTTPAALNSANQRARRTISERVPDPAGQPTPRVLRDERLGRIVERYVEAMERADVASVVALSRAA